MMDRIAFEKVSFKKAKRLMAILSDSYLYGPSYHQTAAAAGCNDSASSLLHGCCANKSCSVWLLPCNTRNKKIEMDFSCLQDANAPVGTITI